MKRSWVSTMYSFICLQKQSYFQGFISKQIYLKNYLKLYMYTQSHGEKRISILASQQIFDWVQGTQHILLRWKVVMKIFTTWLIWLPKFVLIIYFRPTRYKVLLRMVESCLEVLMSCLTALRGSITTGWILSQDSAQMLQDLQITRNRGRIITRILCFHLLIERCVLIARLYHFLFMGFFSVVTSQFPHA